MATNSINLKKSQPTQAKVARELVTIPHYWVINGVVVTNLSSAQEYKNETKSTR